MSSLPGYFLEDFLMWNYDLIVEGDADANTSLKIAEALGMITRRRELTKQQFKPVVDLFEKYREDVERKLDDFDEDEQSWRDYAGYGFDFIPEEIYDKGLKLINRRIK